MTVRRATLLGAALLLLPWTAWAAACETAGAALGDAVRVFEDPEGRAPAIAQALDGRQGEIDYRSGLRIVPDPLALRAQDAPEGEETATGRRQRELREEICRTLDAAAAYPIELRAARQELQALLRRGGFTDAEWRQVASRPSRVGLQFTTRFMALRDAAIAARGIVGEEAIAAARRAYSDRVFEGAQISVAKLAEVMYEIAGLLTPPDAGAGPARYLRMHAYVHPADGGEPRPVRIENYFEVAEFEGVARPRLGVALTQAQRRQFEADWRLTLRAQQMVNDWPARRDALRVELRAELDGLKADLGRAADGLQGLFDGLGRVDEELVARFAASLTAEDRALLDAVRDRRAALTQAHRNLEQKLDALRAGFAAVDLGTLPLMLSDARALEDDARAMKAATDGLATAAQAAFAMLKARAAAAADAQARQTIDELETGVSRAIAPIETRFKGYVVTAENLRRSFDGMLGNERLVANPPMSRDAKPVALTDARPGVLELAGKIADRQDTLRLEIELLEDAPAGGAGTVSKGTVAKEFQVERFGWSDDLSPHLAFVKRRGARAAGEPDVNYQPLPIVAWTRHFRPRPAAEPGFWDGLAADTHPGFGLSAAALDFENKGVQLGVGVQLSLFDDFLFVGYGYNVQAEDPYFYFGLGLTRWLGAFGGEP